MGYIKVGDKVKFQSKEGTVVAVDYDVDRITIDVPEKGDGHNFHYGHISQFQPVVIETTPDEDEPAGKHSEAKTEDAEETSEDTEAEGGDE